MKGDVHRFRPGKTPRGHEQHGERFAIVVMASRYSHLSAWLIVPTSTSAQAYIFRPQVELPGVGPTRVLCDALLSVDPAQRLGEQIGFMSSVDMQQIDYALQQLMDLP